MFLSPLMKTESCLLKQSKSSQWNHFFESFREDEAVKKVLRNCPDSLLCCRFKFLSSKVPSRWVEVVGIWNYVLEQCPYKKWPLSSEVQQWNQYAKEAGVPIYFSSIGEMVLADHFNQWGMNIQVWSIWKSRYG